MVIEVSDFYKDRYKKAYVVINKEPRRVCVLMDYDGKLHSMAYAKYVYTSFYECDIPKGEQIDHINSDKMDDRIENLQKISSKYNNIKDRKGQEMVLLRCPVCGIEFLFPKRNLPFKNNPCCSRKCGGIKSHWQRNDER